MNIVLIGGRAVGKSKVSRRLFYVTKRPVFQLDELIVYEENGMSIPEIVEKHGWKYFRDVEYKVVQKVSKLDDIIIDCGGGVIVDLDENGNEVYSERKVNELKNNGFIIWLTLDVDEVIEKIENDPSRPDLSKEKSFKEIMQRRMPFYKQAADMVFPMHGHTKKTAAEEIIKILQDKGIW
jgi:shikimate kinase